MLKAYRKHQQFGKIYKFTGGQSRRVTAFILLLGLGLSLANAGEGGLFLVIAPRLITVGN